MTPTSRILDSDIPIRTFETGATRDTDQGKHDYEGYLSPLVLERFAEYMTKHRQLPNGQLRDSDNWQKGIPRPAYMKSMWRHFLDVWKEHRGLASREGLEDALCGLLFNVMGFLHGVLKSRNDAPAKQSISDVLLKQEPGSVHPRCRTHQFVASYDNPLAAWCAVCGERQ